MSSTKRTGRKTNYHLPCTYVSDTLLSTKYLLLHLILPTTLWGRYHGYINPILQMVKLKLIKVRKLAPTPTVGKQQDWDVNPGLAGTKWPRFLHCRRLQLSPSRVSFISGNALWSAAHSPAWSWLPFGHPTAMLSHLWWLPKNYITNAVFFLSLYFGHPLELTGKLQSSVFNSTRPWSHLKKYPQLAQTRHICLNLYLEQECSET